MYPICYRRVSGRYLQPEPTMYSRCFRWFPGPLAPSVSKITSPLSQWCGLEDQRSLLKRVAQDRASASCHSAQEPKGTTTIHSTFYKLIEIWQVGQKPSAKRVPIWHLQKAHTEVSNGIWIPCDCHLFAQHDNWGYPQCEPWYLESR